MASKTENEGGAFMSAMSSSANIMVLAKPLVTTTMSAFVPPPNSQGNLPQHP